jgi:Dolichyl-phosphate-mannose-protein mannosyltransferase
MNRLPIRRLIGLGILVVIVHAILLFVVIPEFGNRLGHSYNQDGFTDGYDFIAANLAAGKGYRFYPDTALTMMREPGYPVLLAGLILVFGSNFFIAVKLLNMILALATAWLMMRIAHKLSAGQLQMLAPPLLFLFHPGTLIAESRGGVEMIFAFLITLFLLTIYKALEADRWCDYVVAGLVLGVMVLVRSTPMLFPVFLLGYLLGVRRHEVHTRNLVICGNIALMVLAMLVVLSPWIARNYSLTRKFVPTASMLGVSAQAGQYISTHLGEGKPWWLLDREAGRERSHLAIAMGYSFKDGYDGYYQTFYKSEDELKFSKFLMQRVVAEYARSPWSFVKSVTENLFNFWFAGKTPVATVANVFLQLPYLALALVGAVLGFKNRQTAIVAPLLLFTGYIMAVHAPIIAQARYSIALVPLVSILASITLVAAQRRMSHQSVSVSLAGKTGSNFGDVPEPVGQGREQR